MQGGYLESVGTGFELNAVRGLCALSVIGHVLGAGLGLSTGSQAK